MCVCVCCDCSYWNQIIFEGQTLAFADGGSADNLAITPLLRRRIQKIIVCVAASANISSAAGPADWAGYQWDVSALFGAAPPTHSSYDGNGTVVGIPIDLFNRKLQVCAMMCLHAFVCLGGAL
jgi:hypothetical protein